jgi:hypothetical protein
MGCCFSRCQKQASVQHCNQRSESRIDPPRLSDLPVGDFSNTQKRSMSGLSCKRDVSCSGFPPVGGKCVAATRTKAAHTAPSLGAIRNQMAPATVERPGAVAPKGRTSRCTPRLFRSQIAAFSEPF